MARINIYVPDELHDEVKQLDIEVSRVCQDALRKEVRTMTAQLAAVGDLAAVAARLGNTEASDYASLLAVGKEVGTEWAREAATLRELRSLETMEHQAWATWTIGEGHSLVPFLAEYGDFSVHTPTISSETADELQTAAHRIGRRGEAQLEASDPFVIGIVEGALLVLAAVENRLS